MLQGIPQSTVFDEREDIPTFWPLISFCLLRVIRDFYHFYFNMEAMLVD